MDWRKADMGEAIVYAPVAGWLCSLHEVPDPVFASQMLGDGIAIDPLGDMLTAPVDGTVIAFHEAGHAITIRTPEGIEILVHFGLETVRLGGAGFTPLVGVGAEVKVGDPLLKVDLDEVTPSAKSLITPIVVTENCGYRLTGPARTGPVKCGDPIMMLSQDGEKADGTPIAVATFLAEVTESVRVPLAHGLHARPCAKLADTARGFEAEVRLAKDGRTARLRSPSSMLTLGVAHGDVIEVQASGSDAPAAVAAIAAMIADGMGEAAPFASEPAKSQTVAPVAIEPGSILSGVCASPGLAVGAAWFLSRPEPEIPAKGGEALQERAAFDAARAAIRAELSALDSAILAAQAALVDDDEIIAATHARIDAGASAGFALREVMYELAAHLRASADPLFAERADDLLDLDLRLQWRIAGRKMPQVEIPQGAIVVAADLVPSQVASFDPEHVAGIVTARGGPTSHVAIIAASRGIPALVATGEAVLAIAAQTPLALNASAGRLEVAPGPEALQAAETERQRRARRRAAAREAAGLPGYTADGARIEVFVNLGKSSEAEGVIDLGAEGCGLLRSEFLFLDRASAPNESEQEAEYATIARALDGRPLIVRLLDIGGDKPAPYLPIAPEENPALGLRGIRVSLARPELLSTQIRAILKAGSAGDLRVMAPMISRIEELRAVRAAMVAESEAMGIAPLPLGVMVETPAAAMMADRLAAECEFLSIGTNDLTQYVLAMDRGNPAVAGGVDGLDPAVLRMIDQCCRGAAAQGKWVGVCGGLASDPLAVPILIGLGVTELSAAPAMVAEIKAVVRAVNLQRCRELAQSSLAVSTSGEVRALALALAEEIGL